MTREEHVENLKAIASDMPSDKCSDWIESLMAGKESSSPEKPDKWIPVSERLPKEAGMHLCSYNYDYVDTSYFDISMNEFNIFHEQVTAWMPKPYQPEI